MAGYGRPNMDIEKLAFLVLLASTQQPDVCQRWSWEVDHRGYGRIHFRGKQRLAHRVMWEIFRGPLPKGMTLDHYRMNTGLPCTKSCLNLFHLEPVTSRTNTLRGGGPAAEYARRTHCKHGHRLTPKNVRLKGNTRICRTCHRIEGLRRQKRLQARLNEIRRAGYAVARAQGHSVAESCRLSTRLSPLIGHRVSRV